MLIDRYYFVPKCYLPSFACPHWPLHGRKEGRKEGKGKERKGKERKGKERKGKEKRKGKERKWKERKEERWGLLFNGYRVSVL